MPCYRIKNGVVCYSNQYEVFGRSGRVYHFDYHPFCGPSFQTLKDTPMTRIPKEAWDAFEAWGRLTNFGEGFKKTKKRHPSLGMTKAKRK